MKMLRSVVVSVMFFVLMISMGCTHSVITKQYPIDPKSVPALTSDNPIAIINAQTDTKEVFIGTNGLAKFTGNLQQYTDTVIETLKTELNKKNIRTSKDAEKTLKVSVTKTSLETGMWGFGCDAYVTIETGDGYKKELVGKGGGGVLLVAVNSSVNDAVVAILNDDSVLAYLRR